MRDDGAIAAAEIRLVADIERGDEEPAVLDARAARMIDKVARRSVEHRLRAGRGEGVRRQIGRAERREAERIVEARIVPERAQDPVLDIVESDLLAFDMDELLVPRSAALVGADVEDAGHRVM